ncbi:class I SAM-dependent methyltransferase [Nonomuraea typhae]|uniref:class I SAM-dependent methyltransferase n=1 Tax=Nonomuraea typhae TaxID=2603600 RepID=UPI0012FA2747|nr:class I SAM-dependent methyltransferase [Nonomuraea typhae]
MDAWIASLLPAVPVRILDAGCGDGSLAAQLSSLGHDVTAIDLDPGPAHAAGVPARRADMAAYEDDPFDVIVMSLSLHHMHPLGKALDRAAALLVPGGRLVVDEFAWDWADGPAATWFYDAGVLLGRFDEPVEDPLARWREAHADCATARDMLAAIEARFAVTGLRRVPYLHRYLEGPARLREIEEVRHVPTGFRLTAVTRVTDGI